MHSSDGGLHALPRRIESQRRRLQEVHRALHAPASTVEDVGVDHRRLHALVPEELLHRPDVVAVHQQVRGERMPQGVAGRRLHGCRD
jgi:hypothetical protein